MGHLPRKLSRVCSLFLRRGGGISCTGTGLEIVQNRHGNYIPVNHPESGGTVPIFAAVSRYPTKHFTCPGFLRRRKVSPSFR